MNRRDFLRFAGHSSMIGALSVAQAGLFPRWAVSSESGNRGIKSIQGQDFDLHIQEFPISLAGRTARAVGVNGQFPAPLLRFKEGEPVTINVTNHLKEDTSIHWHGLLVPFYMDGVPGVSFPGIKPGETFQYQFTLPQSGTYWYHSHSGFQEPLGHYGPLIIDPAEDDPIEYDREYVIVLSEWSFESPERIFSKLKKMSETYNFQSRTIEDFFAEVQANGWDATIADRAMWGQMRMSPRDIADVTGATYTYLINGHATEDNWQALYTPGERVRLRIINASAMTIFNLRLPDLPMTIVQADGLPVQPLEVDELQIGVAETYDVIVQPEKAAAYALLAESIDRSGQVAVSLTHELGLPIHIPPLREIPTLTMRDMGMDHGAMGHGNMSHDGMSEGMMDHSKMDHHSNHAPMHHDHKQQKDLPVTRRTTKAALRDQVGVDGVADLTPSRFDEPGLGLECVDHRTLTYADLRATCPNPDRRDPAREIEIHLTGNMERYMWSFDGVKFSEVTSSIKLYEGERVRFTLINNTMMTHPIHLHGMFFDLVNGSDTHRPRKHTVLVKPAEKVSFDVTAEHVGDWAFHCHLLFHMAAGMMQVVSVIPKNSTGESA